MRVAPPNLSAYRVDLGDDDLVLFVWQARNPPAPLSGAEREVLRLLLEGKSNAGIARDRRTSARTVANQIASILKKLGADSRFELMARLGGSPDGEARGEKKSRRGD